MFRLFSIILFAFPLLAQPKLNVDYIEIPEGLVKEKGVTEIFWYGCPACLEYENTLKFLNLAFQQQKPITPLRR